MCVQEAESRFQESRVNRYRGRAYYRIRQIIGVSKRRNPSSELFGLGGDASRNVSILSRLVEVGDRGLVVSSRLVEVLLARGLVG